VTQPSYAPILRSGEVRPTKPTATPEFGRAPKAGLQRHATKGALAGTPAPGEGFALTLAARECEQLHFPHGVDDHDVEVGVGLVAAKRASLAGRGPTVYDVRAVVELFGLKEATVDACAPFAGLGHSYAAQRHFVDSVSEEALFPTK